MAIAVWLGIGVGVGLVARLLAAGRLPLGARGATVAGALGAFSGASLEVLVEGRNRFELDFGSVGGSVVGAAVVLVLFARAGVADPFRGGPSHV